MENNTIYVLTETYYKHGGYEVHFCSENELHIKARKYIIEYDHDDFIINKFRRVVRSDGIIWNGPIADVDVEKSINLMSFDELCELCLSLGEHIEQFGWGWRQINKIYISKDIQLVIE